MSKKQKTTMSESSIQHENFQTKSSFETDSIIDVTESEQTNELISIKYDTNNELKLLICTICHLKYKLTNTPETLAKHLHSRYSNLVDQILDFVVCCQLSFSIVDNFYFITMLNTFDARYQISCQKTIRTQILNKYNNICKIILKELENEEQAQHFLLDLLLLTGQHMAVNIKQAIMQVLDQTKITKKLLGITTDNAQSMIAAGQELKQ
ncbi:16294_t:CDS:2, partial [Cetraspora pellucida]